MDEQVSKQNRELSLQHKETTSNKWHCFNHSSTAGKRHHDQGNSVSIYLGACLQFQRLVHYHSGEGGNMHGAGETPESFTASTAGRQRDTDPG